MPKFIKKTSLDLDDPQTTIERQKILQKKYFLKNIYIDFYKKIKYSLNKQNRNGKIVELGSGGGFIKKIIPKTITSDIIPLPTVDMQFSALDMPFKKSSVNAFVMIDVLHHIPDVELFLREAERCLMIDGQIIMIEPASTFFSRIVWKYFHHEPHRIHASWRFKSSGPLSGANSALPWIVFIRDRKKFQKKFPQLKITKVETHTPLRYILSGGFTSRQLLPNFSYSVIGTIERLLSPLNKHIGLFYLIVIEKHNS